MNDDIPFSASHSDVIRSFLVEMVENRVVVPMKQRRRRRWLVIGVIGFGAVASVGAAAVAAEHAGWIALPSGDASGSPSYAPIPHWPVNARGQTYGNQGDSPVAPDLIEVDGTDNAGATVHGYVLSTELTEAEFGGPMPTSPAQALKQQADWLKRYPNGQRIKVYKSDGTTVVGYFTVGSGPGT